MELKGRVALVTGAGGEGWAVRMHWRWRGTAPAWR